MGGVWSGVAVSRIICCHVRFWPEAVIRLVIHSKAGTDPLQPFNSDSPVNRIRLLNTLQVTVVLTLMSALAMPAMWLIDILFGVFSDDPSVARYLVTSAIVLPVAIGIGLVFDALRFLFPSLLQQKHEQNVTAADRVANSSPSGKSDDS